MPTQAVAALELSRVRKLVTSHLPLKRTASLGLGRAHGSAVLVHLFVDGESHSILWYAPDNFDYWYAPERFEELSQEGHRSYQAAYPVIAIVNAIWSAAPLALFPKGRGDPVDLYSSAPGYRGQ